MAISRHDNRGAHGRPGFTLLELILVMAILAVVAAIVSPRYASSMSRYRAQAAAWRIRADLELARSSARTTGASRSVVFDLDANTYELTDLADSDRPSQTYTVALGDDPYDAVLVSADFGGSAKVTFNGFGTAASGGKVIVESGGVKMTVVLDGESGQVSVE